MNFDVVDVKNGTIDGWYADRGMAESAAHGWRERLGHDHIAVVSCDKPAPISEHCLTANWVARQIEAKSIDEWNNMNRLAQLNQRSQELQQQIDSLNREKHFVDSERTSLDSKFFIAREQIRKDDVCSSNATETWHGTITTYMKWMADNNRSEPYLEWNGIVYRVDLKRGKAVQTPARYSDLS